MAGSRTKGAKVLTKDTKLAKRIGRKHSANLSSLTKTTSALTADDHRTHDCPTRHQPQAPPTSNPANSTGIYQNNSQFQNNSPQQHSQQSASTVGVSTPTLMVNNQPLQAGL